MPELYASPPLTAVLPTGENGRQWARFRRWPAGKQ